jgi:predicted negative regulator of RcsB-dependent stress response
VPVAAPHAPPPKPFVPKAPPAAAAEASRPPEAPKPVPPAPAAPRKSVAATIKQAPPAKKDGAGNGHAVRPPKETLALDADELAAQLLAQEEKPAEPEEPAVQGKPIKAKCFFCEEEHEYAADLAGKQAPCKGCTKIIKIPLPVSNKPKDWREVDQRPSGARRDLDAPDDAWGTGQRELVSTEALVEAEAVPARQAPVSRIKQIKRWVGILLVLAIIGSSAYGIWRLVQQSKQEKVLGSALKAQEAADKVERKLPQERERQALISAEVHRGAAEFYLREDKLEQAQKQFNHAQGHLNQARAGSLERDLALVELVLARSDMAGTQDQVLDRTREKWDKVRPTLRSVMSQIHYREVRVDAVRQVARKLLARGKAEGTEEALGREAEALAAQMAALDERPELLGELGIQMLLAGDKKAAGERVAPNAVSAISQIKTDVKWPLLVALLSALGKEREATAIIPSPPLEGAVSRDTRIAYSLGHALRDNWEEARKLASRPGGEKPHRMEALVNLAELAIDAGKQDVAAAIVDEVVTEAGTSKTVLAPWLQFRLVRAGAHCAKAARMKEHAETVFSSKDAELLLHRALYEVMLGDLTSRGAQPAMKEMDDEAAKKQDAFPPLLELLARHNARHGSAGAVESQVAGWDESLRAAGYVGVALGMQDSLQGMKQTAKGKK